MKKYKIKDHLEIEFINEWEQVDWRKKWNWITATLIHVYFEYEHFGYHFQFTIFGLGLYLRYNTDKSLKLFRKWDKEVRKEFPELFWEETLSSQEGFDKAIKKNAKKTKGKRNK